MSESGFQIAARQARAYHEQTGVFMRPSAERIVESMQLRAGDSFLDLACGTGLVARHARNVVGVGARVVGVDINPAMLAMARSLEADSATEWIEAPADRLPLDDASFDHVVCQQGIQFFPVPPAAVREVHRVLKPGGDFVATVWATPGHNPYIDTQLGILSELDASVAASARAATPLHADALLHELAAEAGFSDVDISMLEHVVRVGDLERFFLEQTAATPWAPTLAGLSDIDRAALAAAFAGRLAAYRQPTGDHLLPFGSHLLNAVK